MSETPKPEQRELHWLVRSDSISKLWIGGYAILALTVLAQLVFHIHPHFDFEGWFGFNAGFGLLSCAAMVIFAKALSLVLKRKDDYYDD